MLGHNLLRFSISYEPPCWIYVFFTLLHKTCTQSQTKSNKLNLIQKIKEKLFQPHPQPDGTLKQPRQPRSRWGGEADFESERSALTSVYFLNCSIQDFVEPAVIEQAAYILIAIGAFILIISVLGYCGALKESRVLLTAYGIFLIIIFLLQVCFLKVFYWISLSLLYPVQYDFSPDCCHPAVHFVQAPSRPSHQSFFEGELTFFVLANFSFSGHSFGLLRWRRDTFNHCLCLRRSNWWFCLTKHMSDGQNCPA